MKMVHFKEGPNHRILIVAMQVELCGCTITREQLQL